MCIYIFTHTHAHKIQCENRCNKKEMIKHFLKAFHIYYFNVYHKPMRKMLWPHYTGEKTEVCTSERLTPGFTARKW